MGMLWGARSRCELPKFPPPGLSPARGSLWDLHDMISKGTGKNALLYYASYGCYCGLGGRGQPKDPTDR